MNNIKKIAMLAIAIIGYALMWWLPIDGLVTGVVLALNKGGAQPVSMESEPGQYWFFIIFYLVVITIVTFWLIIGKAKNKNR